MDWFNNLADIVLTLSVVVQAHVVWRLIKKVDQWDQWMRKKNLEIHLNKPVVVVNEVKEEKERRGNA